MTCLALRGSRCRKTPLKALSSSSCERQPGPLRCVIRSRHTAPVALRGSWKGRQLLSSAARGGGSHEGLVARERVSTARCGSHVSKAGIPTHLLAVTHPDGWRQGSVPCLSPTSYSPF